MYLMYVDESGDAGIVGSPSNLFVLTGLVVHEEFWHENLSRLINLRRRFVKQFGMRFYEEFHAARLISKPGELARIPKYQWLAMLREYANELATMQGISVLTICIDKSKHGAGYDVFENAWKALIQRYENTLAHGNFQASNKSPSRGVLIPDDTDATKLRRLLRKMRRVNFVPARLGYGNASRNLKVQHVIEDPFFRDSRDSFFVQAADVCAYLAYQQEAPNSYMKTKGGFAYYQRLDPILCKVASSTDKQGLVRL